MEGTVVVVKAMGHFAGLEKWCYSDGLTVLPPYAVFLIRVLSLFYNLGDVIWDYICYNII